MKAWIISGSVLIALVFLLRAVFKNRISARLRYALWLLVLLRLLLPVSFGESSLSVANIVKDTELRYTETFTQNHDGGLKDIDAAPAERDTVHAENPEPVREKDYSKNNINYADLIRALWLIGAAVTAVIFIASNLNFGIRLRRSRKRKELPSKLRVYECALLESPCMFGFFRPAVYIPLMAKCGEKELRHIVIHEECHFMQLDHIWSVLRAVCLCMHWYNPLVWAAAVLSKKDAELACDEAVIKRLGEEQRLDYGRTLISLSYSRGPALLSAATTMSGSKKSLKERVRLIAVKRKTAAAAAFFLLISAALTAGCTFSGAAGGQAEVLIIDESPAALQSPPQAESTASPLYNSSFENAEGSISINLELTLPDSPDRLALIPMSSREFSLEESKRIAAAIFPEAVFYEDMGASREYLDEYISVCRTLLEDEAARNELYGDESAEMAAYIENSLDYAENELYPTALPLNEWQKLDWRFVPRESSGAVRNELYGVTEQKGHRYDFYVQNMAEGSNIRVMFEPNSPFEPYYLWTMAGLLSYEKPDEAAHMLAMDRAEEMLEKMVDGDWQLYFGMDYTHYRAGYVIRVCAAPVYEGMALMKHAYEGGLGQWISMDFAPDGTLLGLTYVNPLKPRGESTGTVEIIDSGAALGYAEDYLRQCSLAELKRRYFSPDTSLASAQLQLYDFSLCYRCEGVEENEEDCVLRPVYVLEGEYIGYDGEGGRISENSVYFMLMIDAVDGALVYASF